MEAFVASLAALRRFSPYGSGQVERKAAFVNVKLHAAHFRVCVGHSSRFSSLGFVIGGRSFLPVGMEKGQSIFSAALKTFISCLL